MLCLFITGFDADPDRITDILGIEPTRVGRRGHFRASGRPLHANDWWYEASDALLTDGGMHHDALDCILRRLKGKEDKFATLNERIKPSNITIYGGLYHKAGEQCGLWLDAGQMQLLAACGISWGLDLFNI
jgi:hypothetical protein